MYDYLIDRTYKKSVDLVLKTKLASIYHDVFVDSFKGKYDEAFWEIIEKKVQKTIDYEMDKAMFTDYMVMHQKGWMYRHRFLLDIKFWDFMVVHALSPKKVDED